MGAWSRRIPFKVDVAGIIEIMGTSLYSRATTPVRELIQNAHDGIMRRRQRDLAYTGRIDLAQDAAAGTLVFSDDGIGLNEAEAEKYLGTLGVGITGLIKKAIAPDAPAPSFPPGSLPVGEGHSLIGQFGIGLFSAFMLADRLVVETRRADGDHPAVRWEAGAGTDILLSASERRQPGTTVTLYLKPQYRVLASDPASLEEAVKEYAEFLPVPIHLNGSSARLNLIRAAWFEPTPERESLELELESFFHETALDVIPVRLERPAPVAGALYVTPQRTPGFSSEAVVTVTVRRMVISRQIRGLLPAWAPFIRGVLELNGCSPTASREDLVRDEPFEAARAAIERVLYEHFERLAERDPQRLAAVINWHRYTLAGAALTDQRLRSLLRRTYPFLTTQGPLTFEQVLSRSAADPLTEPEASHVVWYNADRRQERWAGQLFAGREGPCVNAVRSFEESLLAAMAGDAAADESGGGAAEHEAIERVDVRPASPGAPNFARAILRAGETEDAPPAWQEFLSAAAGGARILCGKLDERLPVLAFLNEKHELLQTFDELKKRGDIPAGFQRLIDGHFAGDRPGRNEVLLNTGHRLVSRALAQKTSHPLASVLRLLVVNALSTAGANLPPEARRHQDADLDWVAEALWAKPG
ncbi:MAG TPA: hypothetical protein VFB66_00745 [Tepidisphaeraceae bacterium]|nr:hypothetical protein [Tepidisphaeraceae bacterium]